MIGGGISVAEGLATERSEGHYLAEGVLDVRPRSDDGDEAVGGDSEAEFCVDSIDKETLIEEATLLQTLATDEKARLDGFSDDSKAVLRVCLGDAWSVVDPVRTDDPDLWIRP